MRPDCRNQNFFEGWVDCILQQFFFFKTWFHFSFYSFSLVKSMRIKLSVFFNSRTLIFSEQKIYINNEKSLKWRFRLLLQENWSYIETDTAMPFVQNHIHLKLFSGIDESVLQSWCTRIRSTIFFSWLLFGRVYSKLSRQQNSAATDITYFFRFLEPSLLPWSKHLDDRKMNSFSFVHEQENESLFSFWTM